jgi:hypothetical protein
MPIPRAQRGCWSRRRARRRRVRRPRAEPGAAAAADERTVRTAAYALLAGRDFSRHELATRLLRKGYPQGHVTAAVEAVVREGLLREDGSPSSSSTSSPGAAVGRCGCAWDCARRVSMPRPSSRHSTPARRIGSRRRARHAGASSAPSYRPAPASVQNRHGSSNIAGFLRTRSGPPWVPAKTNPTDEPDP